MVVTYGVREAVVEATTMLLELRLAVTGETTTLPGADEFG